MQNETLRRDFQVEATRDAKGDVIEFTFSSERPVSMGAWDEVLDHSPENADFTRLNSAHPFLLDHDISQVLGVIEKAWLEGKRGKCRVRFSPSPFAQGIKQEVLAGIRKNVSVGYARTNELSCQEVDGRQVRRFAWTAFEVSQVQIPADCGVGIGRSNPIQLTHRLEIMTTDTQTPDMARVADLRAIAQRMGDKIPGARELCQQAIDLGTPVATVQDQLFRMLPGVNPVGRASIDIPDRDLQRYSLSRAINSMCDAREGRGRFDGLEAEASREMELKTKQKPQGFWVPHSALSTRADNIVGTATLGGNLVGTSLDAGSFIEVLRNRSVVANLGARVLSGLVGNITIPRQTNTATIHHVTEIEASTQTNTAFNQITLTPKCASGFEIYSKQLLVQSSPSVDLLIRDDLLLSIASAIDRSALIGAGSGGEPTGIVNTVGITTVTCSTSGIIPTWANILALESAVASANADVGRLAYCTNSAVRGALKAATKNTLAGSAFIWETRQDGQGLMNGYLAVTTNSLPSNNTVGTLTATCSPIIFGNFNDLLLATWQGVDFVADPYTLGTTREVRVFAHQYYDTAVRHAASFSVILDAKSS